MLQNAISNIHFNLLFLYYICILRILNVITVFQYLSDKLTQEIKYSNIGLLFQDPLLVLGLKKSWTLKP